MEYGKIYVMNVPSGAVWLFRSSNDLPYITSCSRSVCLETGLLFGVGYVCGDKLVRGLRLADKNYISLWNRHFPEDSVDFDHRTVLRVNECHLW